LPDGTKARLNAGSSLTYDSSYGKNFEVSSQQDFEVVKKRAFIIHASKINVKVLGTEFNGRSYLTDKTSGF
jgi:ferric-dicitrate binding protein FerR (iron transport regulator)